MKDVAIFCLRIIISVVVAILLMVAFYEVAPRGTENNWLLLMKWIIVWGAIIGYRHATNALDE